MSDAERDAVWGEVDDYFSGQLVAPDPVLDAALKASEEAGLPPISVSANQGKFLMMLARIQGARRMLEIGTLGGYSTIWLARALPADGKLVTLESKQTHADVARSNLDRAGLGGQVEVRVGRALDHLPRLQADGTAPFDLIFIDADKPSIPDYFTWALTLSRPGSIIVVDNVVRNGAVTDPEKDDPGIQGVRRFIEMLGVEKRVTATALQMVGSKGYDGFAIARVNDA